MKSIKFALLGLSMLGGLSTAAMAADMEAPADYPVPAWYLRGDLGWSWMEWDGNSESNLALGGGIGYQYNENLRSDLRADWSGLGSGSDSMTTVLGNLYFDIPTQTVITPYLGAGVGYGWATRDNGSDDNGFAIAAMAGAEVSITDNLSADVGYRYRQIMSGGDDPSDHQVLVGLRYKF